MKLGGGWNAIHELADLDLLTFNALLESLLRIHAAQKSEDAWTTAVATQGTQESIKDWVTSRWEAALSTNRENAERNDLAAFLAKVGKGM